MGKSSCYRQLAGFTCLAVAEPSGFRQVGQPGFISRYVNAMLNTEDSDSQVFLEFIEFVNKWYILAVQKGQMVLFLVLAEKDI